MGPELQKVLTYFGITPQPQAGASAPAEQPGMFKTMAKQLGVPGAAELANRGNQVDGIVAGASGAPQAAPAQPAPARMTPEQMSDWQAVGLGQMRLQEFRQKHGFLPG